MKRTKRIIAVSLVCIFAISGCGKKENTESNSTDTDTTTAVETSATTESGAGLSSIEGYVPSANLDYADVVKNAEYKNMSIGENITVSDELRVDLQQILTSTNIYSVNPKLAKSLTDQEGKILLDVLLDVEWSGKKKDFEIKEALVAMAKNNESGKYYAASTYLMDLDGELESISDMDELEEGKTYKIHCVFSVPQEEATYTICVGDANTLYTYNYKYGDVVSTVDKYTVGDTIDIKNCMNIKVEEVGQSERIENSKGKTIIPTGDTVLYYVKANITNMSDEDIKVIDSINNVIYFKGHGAKDTTVWVDTATEEGFEREGTIPAGESKVVYFVNSIDTELSDYEIGMWKLYVEDEPYMVVID